MKKKNNNNSSQSLDLVTTVDVLNTLSGGISEPQQSFQETEVGRELRIRVPGIHKGLMNVEIHNNHLTIYYYINIASYDKLVQALVPALGRSCSTNDWLQNTLGAVARCKRWTASTSKS